MTDFLYEPQARNARLQIAIALWAAGLVILRLYLGAAWGVLALLALPLIPAIIEQLRNPRRWLRLTDDKLFWHDGFSDQEIALNRIAEARFDTRWDLSTRVRITLDSKDRVRLPPTVTPKPDPFIDALEARGVATSRQHFRVF